MGCNRSLHEADSGLVRWGPFRRACLSIVYGPAFAERQSAGGNIGVYCISLYADQWETVFSVVAVARARRRQANRAKMCPIAMDEIV